MKILLSALACEPGKGSELEVGFRALLAAASRHEVWVLTNSATVPVIRRAIEEYPWADRVHLEGIYFEVDDELYPRLTAPGFHRYYDRWQRKAAFRAADLDRLIDFDVVHHVTLAAHWTRAGVTAVHKPLVWGPVGGGVEMPPSLWRELGWRGVFEEAGRFAVRRLMAKFGPARVAQQRAAFIFAQNAATARRLRPTGELRVLPNATSVLVEPQAVEGPRRHDVLIAARLLPWKGVRLALRAMRYVQHPDAILRIFGYGPEQRRIVRAARRWGLSDRVRFEGRVQRDELLRAVTGAGVFLHPAFHDEAGLAVAEALSLGTPVVCLAWGGPQELLRHWPDAPAEAVPPRSPEISARALAAAIDRFLLNPPPISAPRRSVTSFENELLAAYDASSRDVGRERARTNTTVWAFPAGKPQVFAPTPGALSKGVTVYGFGRRLPKWVQRALALQVRLPVARRMLAEPRLAPPPVCGWRRWQTVLETVQERNRHGPLEWIQFQSQWGKARSSALGLSPGGTPRVFVVVEPENTSAFPRRVPSAASFRVPECVDSFSLDRWSVWQYEPLPAFHRPARWDARRMQRVAEEASLTLEKVLARPPDLPAHWRPIHGDYVPWNVREDDRGELWLLDWEDAGWGPPLTDLVRYVVAYHSLGWSSPERIAGIVKTTVGQTESVETLIEVATFWLSHANLQLGDTAESVPRRKAKDSTRAAREVAAFRVLAFGAQHLLGAAEGLRDGA